MKFPWKSKTNPDICTFVSMAPDVWTRITIRNMIFPDKGRSNFKTTKIKLTPIMILNIKDEIINNWNTKSQLFWRWFWLVEQQKWSVKLIGWASQPFCRLTFLPLLTFIHPSQIWINQLPNFFHSPCLEMCARVREACLTLEGIDFQINFKLFRAGGYLIYITNYNRPSILATLYEMNYNSPP